MIKIQVKINGLEKRRRSIGLMHVVAGFFLLANASSAYKILAPGALWSVAVFFVLAAISIAYGFFRGKADPLSRHNTALRWIQCLSFLTLGLLWLKSGNGAKGFGPLIWAGLSAMLAFSERLALKAPEVELNEQGVSFPNGFSHKEIGWAEIEDLTLRPDFLTLHFPQNRFLQFELKEALGAEAAGKVQDFCRSKLSRGVVEK